MLPGYPVMTDLGSADLLASAKLRGLETKRRVIEQLGGTLTVREVADLLGITRQAVGKRRSLNQLIGLLQGSRSYAYPAFQFERGETLTGLKEISEALSSHDPWAQLLFFAGANDRLNGRTPLEALRTGQLDAVVRVASIYGEQGAARFRRDSVASSLLYFVSISPLPLR
jgi:hypothetical protein